MCPPSAEGQAARALMSSEGNEKLDIWPGLGVVRWVQSADCSNLTIQFSWRVLFVESGGCVHLGTVMIGSPTVNPRVADVEGDAPSNFVCIELYYHGNDDVQRIMPHDGGHGP